MGELQPQIKERPILFSGRMVKAIMRGEKTQTRRIVKPQPPELTEQEKARGQSYGFMPSPAGWSKRLFLVTGDVEAVRGHDPRLANNGIACPYGAPGDRLWVRETWAPGPSVYPFDPFIYRADTDKLSGDDPATAWHVADGKGPHADCYACERERRGFRWRPSIHMPRKASRITIEITYVRIERLHSITRDDCIAEGIERKPWFLVDGGPEKWFQCAWANINGNWSENPWVWVIEFKRALG